ncbi:MAG TPA: hypothetical protein VLA97_06970 [Nocardioidaceae bacterium]|nr:hypothetical protein [Nocardioidaceae bacterium]
MHRRVVVGIVALALVLVAGLAAWRLWPRSAFEEAVAVMPQSTLRATWTDWAQVRTEADGTSLDAGSSSRDVANFLSSAYDQDLTSTSAVADSTYAMARRFGFSPVDATWEMYGQAREGAVVALRFGDEVDLAGVERNLRRLGYTPPADGAGAGGVWAGSADLVAQIDPTLTPVLQNVVVLPEEGLVLLSDNAAYASSAADTATGDADSLADVGGTTGLADAAGEPVSAVLYASDFACEALSMAAADEEDQAVAEELVAQSGGVSPLAGLVIALDADRSMTVAMHFESGDQAEENLRPRLDLASGEAVGQGGTFADRFRVEEARTDGSRIVMDLRPASGEEALLSDLTQGPVLFATC